MKKKTRVTMFDIAKEAHVTPQTVSRAFRNAPDISDETRSRILQIAADLNYVKNNTASSLRNGNSRLIAIVYDNLMNVYFSIMIDYLQRFLMQDGYSILAISVSELRLNGAAYKFALSHNAAGIVSFLEPNEEISALIGNYGIPVLLLGRRTPISAVDFLRTDDEEGGRRAARVLAEDGCKKLAFLSIDLSVSCAVDRYNGFSEELSSRGLGRPVVLNGYSVGWEEEFIARFRDPATAPDGIFCFNDMLAFSALYIIEKYGLPKVKIVGFDCVQEEIYIPKRLTSVGVDKQKMAQRAAQIIVSRVEGGHAPRFEESMGVSVIGGETA